MGIHLVTRNNMQMSIWFALFSYGILFEGCIIEAKPIDFSECTEMMLTVIRGGPRETQTERRTGPLGIVEDRIKAKLESLYEQITSLTYILHLFEDTNQTLWETEEIDPESIAMQQYILKHLEIDDIITEEMLTEAVTEVTSTAVTCQNDQFLCDDGNCINKDWKCDGEMDCRDGSDETDMTCKPECAAGYFRCSNGNCIAGAYRCDTDNDCGDMSDENEETCPHLYEGRNEEETTEGCRSDQFSCYNGFCIDGDWQCDGEEDCIDGSDEADDICKTVNCRSNQFTCDNGNCIRNSYKCDGDNDCGDFSDENEYTCPRLENEKQFALNANQRTLVIRHPENALFYDNDEEYGWTIWSKDPQAVGFEVLFNKMEIETCCDKLRIKGDHCSYGPIYLSQDKPDLEIEGDAMRVSWKSDSSSTFPGFSLTISLLYELNKTECFDYTCEDSGRCLRIHYDDELSWDDSAAACEAEGARLVVISDEDTQKHVRRLFDTAYIQPWIGMSGNSSNMTWITGKSPTDYGFQYWEDDSLSFSDRRCVTMGYRWNVGWCDLGRPFICEKLRGN